MRSRGDERELQAAERSGTGTRGRPSAGAGRDVPQHKPRDPGHGTPTVHLLTIYVSHPSACLTDHLPHGDGLMAYEFISRLARRGHTVHVAVPRAEITGPLPDCLILHPYQVHAPRPSLAPLATMLHVRRIVRNLARSQMPDIIHQWNPVEPRAECACQRFGRSARLGAFVPDWPHEDVPGPRRRGSHSLARAATAAVLVGPIAFKYGAPQRCSFPRPRRRSDCRLGCAVRTMCASSRMASTL